jgi:hypothetical protein
VWGERWIDLVPLIPPELRPFMLDFEWDIERLHGLDLPVELMSVAKLVWHLELPWWRGEGPFCVRPVDVLRRPGDHPVHRGRILKADLRHPLEVTWREDVWTIMDGIHRLAKAVVLGLPRVAVRKVPASAFADISVRRAA